MFAWKVKLKTWETVSKLKTYKIVKKLELANLTAVAPHFYETQWRHSVKTRLYNTPLPHTSFCETQWCLLVKTKLYKNPPPYFIVLASSVKPKKVEVMEYKIWNLRPQMTPILAEILSFFVSGIRKRGMPPPPLWML